MSLDTPLLIDVEALRRRMDSSKLRLFDCRFSLTDPDKGRNDYAAGHIPGACYVHLEEDLSRSPDAASGRHPLPEAKAFMRTLERFGVADDSEVVVYDDSGGTFALRMWWMMRHWLGHRAVALLDGGIGAWLAAAGALETATPPSPPQTAYAGAVCEPALVPCAEVVVMVENADGVLLDARAAERFRGEVEPLDPVAGHIPGALNLPFEGNLDEHGRFLSPARLRRRFEEVPGATQAPAAVVHTCGSGVTACHNLFAMELAGLPGSRLYVGSWSEWLRDTNRPVARGEAHAGANNKRG